MEKKKRKHTKKSKIKKNANKLKNNVLAAACFGLATVFAWMIVRGALDIVPNVNGSILIVIGIAGLGLLGYFGKKKFI